MDLDKVVDEWKGAGFNCAVQFPIRTLQQQGDSDYAVIRHNSSLFVWINGTDSLLPAVLIPAFADHPQIGAVRTWTLRAYADLAEYLTLITFLNPQVPAHVDTQVFPGAPFTDFSMLNDESVLRNRRPRSFPSLWPQPIVAIPFVLPPDQKVRDALSFFSEGMSVNNEFLSFLSTFKVMELLFAVDSKSGRGKDWTNFDLWIDMHASEIFWFSATQFLGEFDADHKLRQLVDASGKGSIGKYLRKQHRDAIAHGKFDGSNARTSLNIGQIYETRTARKFLQAAAYLAIYELLGGEISAYGE
jgi:hypothetical protein